MIESKRDECITACRLEATCAELKDYSRAASAVEQRCARKCDGPWNQLARSCKKSEPILSSGVNSGLSQCEDGAVHRPKVVACRARPRTQKGVAGKPKTSFEGCTTDADCTDKNYGMCRQGIQRGTQCVYGCLKDADCGPNAVCSCSEPYGVCEPASCTSDADCQGDALCARAIIKEGGCTTETRFMCQSPNDECDTAKNCSMPDDSEVRPRYFCSAASGTRMCELSSGIVCGRPFLVRGAPKLAERGEAAWRDENLASPRAASPELTETLAEAWTRLGLMEHASIAAFARFSMQLLQLGAPAELLEQCAQAMADETKHAQMCFTLASEYKQSPVGPGPLEMVGALDDSDMTDIVLNTIAEGCVGETVAALEAAEAAAHCEDPSVRSLLEQVKSDELSHASLAWRFLAWARTQKHAGLDAAIENAFAALQHEVETTAINAPESRWEAARNAELLAYGVVPKAVSAKLRLGALRDVVLPCAREVLGAIGGPSNAGAHAAAPTLSAEA